MTNLPRFGNFKIGWHHLLVQGTGILVTGGLLALASIFNANTMILFASELSWLPVSGMVILTLGILECIEAFLAKEAREFQHNVQVGVLDSVVGGMIILSVAEDLVRFGMMLAAFLITRGSVRIIMVYSLQLPNKISTACAGLVSVILGVMLWQQWPFTGGWFLSLCLNIEIMFRGWSTVMFAFWIKKQNQ
ncbi:MAG: hypothetical protein ABL903_15010 [Methylococcales bacterium]